MKIGFVGIGNMGSAILRGYYPLAKESGNEILVFQRTIEKMYELAKELDVYPCENVNELVQKSDIVILGIKPKDFEALLENIEADVTDEKIIVSMAAGISITYIKDKLKGKGKIIRIMPNTPALVKEGVTSISREESIEDEIFDQVKAIFEGIGKAVEVPEDMIHTVIGVSGSSPAYTYMYIDALARSAEKRGMTREDALEFAAQAVLGAAKMVMETGVDPDQLKINVCSPNGATIEAVEKLEAWKFYDMIDEGFEAAYARSKELTK